MNVGQKLIKFISDNIKNMTVEYIRKLKMI